MSRVAPSSTPSNTNRTNFVCAWFGKRKVLIDDIGFHEGSLSLISIWAIEDHEVWTNSESGWN